MSEDIEILDRAIVDASYYFPVGIDAPDVLTDVAKRIDVAAGRGTVYHLSDYQFSEDIESGLETQMEAALAALLDQARATGISRSDLQRMGAQLSVRIALIPNDGQAGAFVSSQSLADWASLGADLRLNAWPGSSWHEARYP